LVELSGAASSHLVGALELASELGLDVGEDLVEEGVDLGLVEEVNSVAQVLLFVVLEVSLVMDIFVLNLSDFLDLVVVDVKLFAVEGSLVKFSLSLGSLLGILEADKGIKSLTFLRKKLDVFDFTIFSEEFFKLLFGSSGREVLDIKVASLLGVLISEHLLGLFNLSISFPQSFFAVEFFAINHFIVELFYSFHGSLGTGFLILA
jgi:hypothetical protein